jgi:hypothetical protein
VAVEGQCCVTTYPGDGYYGPDGKCIGLCDPDGFPIQANCQDPADLANGDVPDGSKCRQLPNSVANRPGVVNLPDGCEQALADAGMCDGNDPECDFEMANRRLELSDVPDENELWGKMCFLPQWDQDFDGLGDACDLCPFSFDPNNEPYVDENTGKLWSSFGKYCAGAYSPDAICAAQDAEDTDTDDGTGTDGGTDGGTGG